MAAQCTTFAVNGEPESERWRPFVAWAKALGPGDTIVTFNYDPVLERLHESTSKFDFPTPGSKASPSGDLVPVYKLHGSVNWRLSHARIKAQQDLEFATKCRDEELALATPGPSKHTDVEELYKPLWEKAEAALATANSVVFVGYRFPPSDAFARERLLRALWKNESNQLLVYIVLGPNLQHEDVIRLQRMIEWTILSAEATRVSNSRFKVRPEPLYCEDYFTTWRQIRTRGSPEGIQNSRGRQEGTPHRDSYRPGYRKSRHLRSSRDSADDPRWRTWAQPPLVPIPGRAARRAGTPYARRVRCVNAKTSPARTRIRRPRGRPNPGT